MKRGAFRIRCGNLKYVIVNASKRCLWRRVTKWNWFGRVHEGKWRCLHNVRPTMMMHEHEHLFFQMARASYMSCTSTSTCSSLEGKRWYNSSSYFWKFYYIFILQRWPPSACMCTCVRRRYSCVLYWYWRFVYIVHTYIHTYDIHTCTHTYTTYIHTYIHVHMYGVHSCVYTTTIQIFTVLLQYIHTCGHTFFKHHHFIHVKHKTYFLYKIKGA